MKISKKGIVSLFSNINWIFLSKLFKTEIINPVVPIFIKQILSSIYRFQNVIYFVKLGRGEFLSSILNIFAKTVPGGESMAAPSVCTYVLDSKVKWTFFRTGY